MHSNVCSVWASTVGKGLLAFVLLGIRPAPAACDPRLLWRQDIQGG